MSIQLSLNAHVFIYVQEKWGSPYFKLPEKLKFFELMIDGLAFRPVAIQCTSQSKFRHCHSFNFSNADRK